MTEMSKLRAKYEDIITKGSYIPLKTSNSEDKIIAYARHLNGKTLLVIANQDVNCIQSGKIHIEGLNKNQKLSDIAPENSKKSNANLYKNGISVELAPAKFMMFEIDTPKIEKSGVKVYKQNNIG